MELQNLIKYNLLEEQRTFFSFLKDPDNESLSKILTDNEKVIFSLINRHRLVPFFYKNKEKLADNIQEFVYNQYLKNAQRMLLFAGEMLLISQICEKRGIETIFLKGPALAYELHQDFSARQMVDLDIYIEKEDLNIAYEELIKLGYKPTDIPNSRFRKFILKDNYYFHPEKKVSLEIHYRFFPNKFLDKAFKQSFPELTKNLEIKSKKVKVLTTEANLVFLVLHGSNHQWFRLFWLKDLSDFILQKQMEWTRVIEISNNLGIIKTLIQSVVLANLFFNAPIPIEIQNIRKNDKAEKYLIRKAVNAIISPVHENIFTRIGRLVYLSRLSSKWNFKWNTIIGGALRFVGK